MEFHLEILHVPKAVSIYANAITRKVYLNAVELKPDYSITIRKHSATGFAWGYNGSGPAQLALAILLNYVSAPLATVIYQAFKKQYIAQWHPDHDVDTTINLQTIVSDLLQETEIMHVTF